MTDSYNTIAALSTGEFKDRGSKFIAYAWPVTHEAEALKHLESLRKEHFKASHHCFAWRFDPDGSRFRANDDGEPSGTAGRPILAQINSFSLTYIMVVVVRYFGGTLLGASGLIHAYREAAAEALRNAQVIECLVKDFFLLDFDYILMPDIMNAVKKLELDILHQSFEERGQIEIGIRQSETVATLLRFRALLWKVSEEEAAGVDWPAGLLVTPTVSNSL